MVGGMLCKSDKPSIIIIIIIVMYSPEISYSDPTVEVLDEGQQLGVYASGLQDAPHDLMVDRVKGLSEVTRPHG